MYSCTMNLWRKIAQKFKSKKGVELNLPCRELESLSAIQLTYGLKSINLFNNRLVELPNFPNSVEYIDCAFNMIKCLPERLPISLTCINCIDNPIDYLPLTLYGRKNIIECDNKDVLFKKGAIRSLIEWRKKHKEFKKEVADTLHLCGIPQVINELIVSYA